MNFDELYLQAKNVTNKRQLSEHADAGGVGAAILTDKGNLYLGVCLDTVCSLGFCAEVAASAQMITNGENIIKKVIAVSCNGTILPPCGRCREFMIQLSDQNGEAEVMVGKDTVVKLKDLMPHYWQ
jgi:cytidine deaminase